MVEGVFIDVNGQSCVSLKRMESRASDVYLLLISLC